jgi:hypothetical protein
MSDARLDGELRSNRETLASHFHRIANISRAEIFGASDAELRPTNLPDDANTMFAGYVGINYRKGRGLLLLAINPGGGGDAYTQRTPEDGAFYPLLVQLKTSSPEKSCEAFDRINNAFVGIVQRWNLWRVLQPTLEAAGRSIDEVAYMNVVPYRTRGDKMPPIAARRWAWAQIVGPTIQLLEPRAIIALGKKAGSVVDALLPKGITLYCVPRTIGDTYLSTDALKVHERIRKAFKQNRSP